MSKASDRERLILVLDKIVERWHCHEHSIKLWELCADAVKEGEELLKEMYREQGE